MAWAPPAAGGLRLYISSATKNRSSSIAAIKRSAFRAGLKRPAVELRSVEFTTRFISPPPFLSASLVPPETRLSLTSVLRIVVPQPCLRRLFPLIQRHLFLVAQIPQPGKVPSPGASLAKLLFESLTFQTAQNTA
jgi:hypothetical protein